MANGNRSICSFGSTSATFAWKMSGWVTKSIPQRDVLDMALQDTLLEGIDLMALGCCSKDYNSVAHRCWNYVRCRQIVRLNMERLEKEKMSKAKCDAVADAA